MRKTTKLDYEINKLYQEIVCTIQYFSADICQSDSEKALVIYLAESSISKQYL